MATRIRLRRVGRKKQPEYRIVVAESTNARDGNIVATLGHYNPRTTPAKLTVDIGEVRAWIAKGATSSDTVRSLLKRAGVFTAMTEPPVAPAAPSAEG